MYKWFCTILTRTCWYFAGHESSALKHGGLHCLCLLTPDCRQPRLVSSTVHIKLAAVSTSHAACSYFLVKIVRVISICLRDLVSRIPRDCWDQYLICGIKAPSSKPDCNMAMGVVCLHVITSAQCIEWCQPLSQSEILCSFVTEFSHCSWRTHTFHNDCHSLFLSVEINLNRDVLDFSETNRIWTSRILLFLDPPS
jgi:hypothetical protein